MAVPNGNNAKDWVIRRRLPKPDMAGHGSVSTIAKRWVDNDGLANRSLLKVRSSPHRKLWGISKTHLLANLLLQNLLKFDKLFVFSPSIEQPKYKMLQDMYSKIDEEREKEMRKKIALMNRKAKKSGSGKVYQMPEMDPIAEFHTSPDEFKLDDLDEDKTTLIVLDDLMLARQGPLISLFSRGRHKGVSLCYLTQSYYQTPKVIRQNCSSFIIIAPTTKREITLLRQDLSPGVDEQEFSETLKHILKKQYNFFYCDLMCKEPKQMFRLGFDTPLFIDRFNQYS